MPVCIICRCYLAVYSTLQHFVDYCSKDMCDCSKHMSDADKLVLALLTSSCCLMGDSDGLLLP